MKLELTVRNGLMTAHVQAETDTARNMLLDHLPQLRERLADHNIKIDQFEVELKNQSQTGMPQNFANNPQEQLAQPQPGSKRPSVTSGETVPATVAGSVRAMAGRLDVTV